MINETNIIKTVCKALNFTYAQLAEQIGYTEGALKTSVSTDKISNSMKKAIELYLKTIKKENILSQAKDTNPDNENIVKKVCAELGITQKALSEVMKINEVTVRNWSSKGQIPDSSITFMELLLENKKLKVESQEMKQVFSLLNKYTQK